MTRPVGQLGEALLAKWAAEVGAACNKAVVDRAGWDFLVEFTIGGRQDGKSLPLDRIPAPLQCLIQVKSTDVASRRVETSLANWLRLVRSPLPTFFLLLSFEDSSECRAAYLSHVNEALIRRTLKRLRSLTTQLSAAELNRRNQSLTVPASDLLPECTGKALAEAIHRHVHPDLETYVSNKRRLLETLGYEQGSARLDVTIRVPESHRQRDARDLLVDFAIGTVKELEVTQGTVTDIRFGIPAPTPDHALGEGVLRLQHTPVRSGQLALRNQKTNEFVTLPCNVYGPAGVAQIVPADRLRFRLSVPCADFVLAPNGDASPFTLRLPPPDELQPLSTLRGAAQLIEFLSHREGDGSLTCTLHLDELQLARLKVDGPPIDPYLARWASVVNDAAEVAARFKIHPDVQVESRSLLSQTDAIALTRRFATGDAKSMVVKITMSPPLNELRRAYIPYIAGVTIGLYRLVTTVLLSGNMQGLGELPVADIAIHIDKIDTVDRWTLFKDEPLPKSVPDLLAAAEARCGSQDCVIRLGQGAVSPNLSAGPSAHP
jgi:hypothetical protein